MVAALHEAGIAVLEIGQAEGTERSDASTGRTTAAPGLEVRS